MISTSNVASARRGHPRQSVLRRAGMLFALLLVIAAFIGAASVFTANRSLIQGPVVTTLAADGPAQPTLQGSGATLEIFDDETLALQWRLEVRHVSLDSLESANLAQVGEVAVVGPRLSLFDEAGKVKARVEADRGRIDAASRVALLDGLINATLAPGSAGELHVQVSGPLEIILGVAGSLEESTAHSTKEVHITTKSFEVMGVGLELDLLAETAKLAGDVRAIARLRPPRSEAETEADAVGGGPLGGTMETLVLSSVGSAVFARHGGNDGVTPTLTLSDGVAAVGNDGLRLDCEELYFQGVGTTSSFVSEMVTASGAVKLALAGMGELEGDYLSATLNADESWQTTLVTLGDDLVTGTLYLDTPAGDRRMVRLTSSTGIELSQTTTDAGEVLFRDSVRAQVLRVDGTDTGGRLTSDGGLRVRLSDDEENHQGSRPSKRRLGRGIREITALGASEILDPEGELIGLANRRGDDTTDSSDLSALQVRSQRALNLQMTPDGRIAGLTVDGNAEIELRGINLDLGSGLDVSLLDETAATAPQARPLAPQAPTTQPAAEEVARSDLHARADRITCRFPEATTMVFTTVGETNLEELGEDGHLRRSLHCDGLEAKVEKGMESSVFSSLARGSDDVPVKWRDETLSPALHATGREIEIKDSTSASVRGFSDERPAVIRLGLDVIRGQSLAIDLTRQVISSPTGLTLTIDRSDPEPSRSQPPIVGRGLELRRDLERELMVFVGSRDKPVRIETSRVSQEQGSQQSAESFELVAPHVEIDPKRGAMACPQGGRIYLVRPTAGGGSERVLLEATTRLDYKPQEQRANATGSVHLRVERQDRPFELWADQVTGYLVAGTSKAPAGSSASGMGATSLNLDRVTGTGNVRVQSGPYEVTGHEVTWNLRKEMAVLTPRPRETISFHDRTRGFRVETLEVRVKEGASEGQGRSYWLKGVQFRR